MSTKVNLVPDENGNDPFVQISGTNIMQPIDIQSHLQTTVQTHNAVSVTASTTNASATWNDASGFTSLSVTILNDATTSNGLLVYWSNDGSTIHGVDQAINDGAPSFSNAKAANIPVKARYFKIAVRNLDTIAHTMSAWAFLIA